MKLYIVLQFILFASVNASWDKKITICHYNHGTKTWNTIEISKNAWVGHIFHGDGVHFDHFGPCVITTNSPTPFPTRLPTNSPTMEPTDSPTMEPTNSPTTKPTDSPTMEPTNSPTTKPTDSPTMEPTNGPTMKPTDSPTMEPTDIPTTSPTPLPTFSCPNGVIQIALDRSRSINKKEMNRQKAVIESLVNGLDIHENAMKVGMSSFAKDYYHDIGLMSSSQIAINSVENFLAKKQKRMFYTEFIPIFTHAQEVLPLDSTIVIVSDGKPYTKKYGGKKKSVTESCKARQKLRISHPDVKVLCFQSTKKSNATPFFKCACDAIWLANEHKGNEAYIADQMKNFVCNKFTKQNNPCRSVGNKKECRNVVKNNMGGDQMSIFDTMSGHCYWAKGKCRVKPQFEPIYN